MGHTWQHSFSDFVAIILYLNVAPLQADVRVLQNGVLNLFQRAEVQAALQHVLQLLGDLVARRPNAVDGEQNARVNVLRHLVLPLLIFRHTIYNSKLKRPQQNSFQLKMLRKLKARKHLGLNRDVGVDGLLAGVQPHVNNVSATLAVHVHVATITNRKTFKSESKRLKAWKKASLYADSIHPRHLPMSEPLNGRTGFIRGCMENQQCQTMSKASCTNKSAKCNQGFKLTASKVARTEFVTRQLANIVLRVTVLVRVYNSRPL